MVEVIFERNLKSVDGSPRTVEAWLPVAPRSGTAAPQFLGGTRPVTGRPASAPITR